MRPATGISGKALAQAEVRLAHLAGHADVAVFGCTPHQNGLNRHHNYINYF
jgi:hypothetical protein